LQRLAFLALRAGFLLTVFLTFFFAIVCSSGALVAPLNQHVFRKYINVRENGVVTRQSLFADDCSAARARAPFARVLEPQSSFAPAFYLHVCHWGYLAC
jgi:hypothetical protein